MDDVAEFGEGGGAEGRGCASADLKGVNLGGGGGWKWKFTPALCT